MTIGLGLIECLKIIHDHEKVEERFQACRGITSRLIYVLVYGHTVP
jgi:hypothetical protein